MDLRPQSRVTRLVKALEMGPKFQATEALKDRRRNRLNRWQGNSCPS